MDAWKIAVLITLLCPMISGVVLKTLNWAWHWCITVMTRRKRREVLGVADSISRRSIMPDQEMEGIMPVHREEAMPFTDPIMESDLELYLGERTAKIYYQGGNGQAQSTFLAELL